MRDGSLGYPGLLAEWQGLLLGTSASDGECPGPAGDVTGTRVEQKAIPGTDPHTERSNSLLFLR